jgi:hypothetical protein
MIVVILASSVVAGLLLIPTILTPDEGMERRGSFIVIGCTAILYCCTRFLGLERPFVRSITFILYIAMLGTALSLPVAVAFNYETIGLEQSIVLFLIAITSGLVALLIYKFCPKLDLSELEIES